MLRAADLAHRLGQDAEAVCSAYLPNGCRQGRYWLCGDVMGTPGRSLYVLLSGERAGKWTDGQSGEHGDLLDLISLNRGLDFRATLDEARQFLSVPTRPKPKRAIPVRSGTPDAARRLFAASKPIHGTLAASYLQSRGIVLPSDASALRFHPRCFYRSQTGLETWPALIAAVTDSKGVVTGAHRTWLDPHGGKAPVDDPRRAMGCLVGNGVRFGVAHDVLTAAEGIETALAIKTVMPDMPIIATLSAAHLAALILPRLLKRLYVALDNDEAGRFALKRLRERFQDSAIDIRALVPKTEDFNADLLTLGQEKLKEWIGQQVVQNLEGEFSAQSYALYMANPDETSE
ncbi:MAG: toprim domain-containing protein [Alphaproteobacteria bacterium]|nr:toprim domain-containing protein [Alphaproteobacteria bacterium]